MFRPGNMGFSLFKLYFWWKCLIKLWICNIRVWLKTASISSESTLQRLWGNLSFWYKALNIFVWLHVLGFQSKGRATKWSNRLWNLHTSQWGNYKKTKTKYWTVVRSLNMRGVFIFRNAQLSLFTFCNFLLTVTVVRTWTFIWHSCWSISAAQESL